ncbi:MAG: DUF4333 domain-containing protein [Actinobacteria bacterium]|nr:DUF4333 domain-containing protein [Actinomycetota bacterium]
MSNLEDTMRTRPLITIGAAALLALTGCSFSVSSGGIDTQKVEDEITTGLKEQANVTVTTVCPDNVPLKAGDTFTCTATTTDGEAIDVTVTQQDDQGNVRWEVTGSGETASPSATATSGAGYLAMDKVVNEIETGIQKQLGFAVTADCPAEVEISNGGSFTCQVVDDQGSTADVRVVMTDDKGTISWELIQETPATQ